MISFEDAPHTYEYAEHYKILPAINNWSHDPERISGGLPVALDFTYCSDNNTEWMSIYKLQAWIHENRAHIGKI